MDSWPKIEIDVRAEAAEDIGAELLDAGATGVEEVALPEGRARLVAYFNEPPDPDAIARRLEGLDGVLTAPRSGSTPDDDWLRIWKRGFEPIPIGRRLLVLPSWKRDRAQEFPDRAHVEIDPGMAFGTGTHETTRMCLEWIDANWHGGTFLDVGTGSGILAIAAAVLEPESLVAGVDVDPVAVEVARENAEANRAGQISFGVAGPEGVRGYFDIVVANLTADVILQLLDPLLDRVRPTGTIVLSGILIEQGDSIVAALETQGFRITWRREAGEWVALAAEAPVEW